MKIGYWLSVNECIEGGSLNEKENFNPQLFIIKATFLVGVLASFQCIFEIVSITNCENHTA